MTLDVRLITRNDATFTAKPRSAAMKNTSPFSTIFAKSPEARSFGTSRKRASPHIHAAQIGAMRYKPSNAPNLRLQRSRCVNTSRVASDVSAAHMMRNPVRLKWASPKDEMTVPADIANTDSATFRDGASTPLRYKKSTTTQGVNA